MKYCDHCHSSYPGDFTTCPKDRRELRLITDLLPGLVLRGKYEILERLGAGGMGAVYKARHVAFDEVRALKFIGSHLGAEPEFLARFKAEAVLARRLQHPGVVRIDDFDTTDDGRPFIVMEYVEGRSLRSALRQAGAFPARLAVEIARQIALALQAAHALGILHRDIKPENVVLVPGPGGEEVVKVLDFGLAKVRQGFEGATQQVSTETGMMVGTPQYMAPEQALPDKGLELDGRVDVYSLGVVLYEMVTGALPFEADTPMAMVLHHLQTRPRAPHVAHPDRAVPPALSGVVLKALEKDRERRYADAGEMVNALAALAPVLPLGSAVAPTAPGLRPATPSGLRPTVAPAARRETSPATSGARRTVARPEVRASVADEAPPRSWGLPLVGLVLAGVLAIGLWSRSAPSVPATSTVPTSSEEGPASETDDATSEVSSSTQVATPADDAIQAEVQQLLTEAPALQDARLEVAVANGIVSLSGEAPSSTARDLAASLARSVGGATRVFNMVKVVPAASATPPAPAALAADQAVLPTDDAAARPPLPSASGRDSEARALLDKAKRQIDAGDHEGAARTFEEVLRVDPNNPVATDALERWRSRPPRPGPPPPGPPR